MGAQKGCHICELAGRGEQAKTHMWSTCFANPKYEGCKPFVYNRRCEQLRALGHQIPEYMVRPDKKPNTTIYLTDGDASSLHQIFFAMTDLVQDGMPQTEAVSSVLRHVHQAAA